MSKTEMTAGRRFIAGRRVASGEALPPRLKAADGDATGHRFLSGLGRRPHHGVQAAAQGFAAYCGNLAETRARFWRLLPMN